MIREYGLPVLLALLVHSAVAAALFAGWAAEPPDTRNLVRPNIIQAQLLVMSPPPAAPQPAPQPAPAVDPARQERQEQQEQQEQERLQAQREAERREAERRAEERRVAERQAAERREAERREAERREAERREAQRRAEEQRQQRLQELATDTFDRALATESERQAQAQDAQIAQSFSQGIYQLVVANWSRPPSARTGMQTLLQVDLVPTGEVVGVTVLQSSGNTAFDRSAEQAVRRVGQFDVPNDSRLFERHFRRFQLLFRPEDLLR